MYLGWAEAYSGMGIA